MIRTLIPIQALELAPADQVFFHLFNNFSIFVKEPLQKQITLILSLTDPTQLLRYAEHSKRFYDIAKSPALLSHWQKNLGEPSPETQHPFDTLLSRHCQDMAELAREEDNKALAEAFVALAKKYDRKEMPSNNFIADKAKSPMKFSRKLPCNF